MTRGAVFRSALMLSGCLADHVVPPAPIENLQTAVEQLGNAATPGRTKPSSEPEILLRPREAADLADMFDLPRCGNIARLRDVRRSGLLAQSWRVRGNEACFADWSARQQKYGMLDRLMKGATKADLDNMRWQCGEDGGHVAQCFSQGTPVTLVIENPRFATFLLLRRITRTMD